jgi:hypothetical protein
MSTSAVQLPTCSKCGFDPVEINRPYAKEYKLCDVCCNKALQITWHAGSKTFHSRREADAWRVANKRVKPAFAQMVMPTSPTNTRAVIAKAPIVSKGGRIEKQPISVLQRPERRPCVIDLTCDLDLDLSVVDRHPADIDIEMYDATEPYRGLTPDHN